MGYVYLIRNGSSFAFKIGIAHDVESRLAQLQTGNPVDLALESSYEFPNADHVERVLHQKWASRRMRGEWFDLNVDDLEEFEQICTLLGGVPYVPNAEVSTDAQLDEAEEVQQAIDIPNAWDFAEMFANGWKMYPLGNGRTNGDGKYWSWRKRKNGERGYIYGGKISDLPHTIDEMRRIYDAPNALGEVELVNA
jgi:hypothetical protein